MPGGKGEEKCPRQEGLTQGLRWKEFGQMKVNKWPGSVSPRGELRADTRVDLSPMCVWGHHSLTGSERPLFSAAGSNKRFPEMGGWQNPRENSTLQVENSWPGPEAESRSESPVSLERSPSQPALCPLGSTCRQPHSLIGSEEQVPNRVPPPRWVLLMLP